MSDYISIMKTNIIKRYDLSELESKEEPLWWQEKGLSYTRTGYGKKIPTSKMVKLPDSNRWRRVYCCVYSNAGTCYVESKGGWIVIR